MIDSVISPLVPKNPAEWVCLGDVRETIRSVYPAIAYQHPTYFLQVFSAVEVVNDPKERLPKGPEYHLSICRRVGGARPTRCSAAEAAWVLEQFGLDGWEEDNHVPDGVVRNFWRPVAEPLIGIECECKDQENVVVEGDFETRPLPVKP